MPNLTIEQMDDAVLASLRHIQKGKLAKMRSVFNNYHTMKEWFERHKVILQGGTAIEQRIANRMPGSTRMITIDQTDNPHVPRLLDKLVVPWRHMDSDYSWYIESDILVNSGPAEVVDMLSVRRDACFDEIAHVMEVETWSLPSATQNPQVSAYGVPYYIVTDVTAGDGKQTTALPSGWSDIAGLVPSATPGWTNWAAVYSAVTDTDFLKKMRRAFLKTSFMSPYGRDEFYGPKGRKYVLYCGTEAKLAIEDIAKAQNENVGFDVAKFDNMTTVLGNKLVPVDLLDTAALSPVYGINHNTFGVRVLKGAFFREDPPRPIPTNMSRGRTVKVNVTFNFYCDNRRHNFVLHKAA